MVFCVDSYFQINLSSYLIIKFNLQLKKCICKFFENVEKNYQKLEQYCSLCKSIPGGRGPYRHEAVQHLEAGGHQPQPHREGSIHAQYTLHTAKYASNTEQYTLNKAHYTLHTAQSALHTTQYKQHTTYYALHTTHYALFVDNMN